MKKDGRRTTATTRQARRQGNECSSVQNENERQEEQYQILMNKDSSGDSNQ